MKTILPLIFSVLFLSGESYSQAEIRMVAHDLHMGQLVVELQVKAADKPFMLSSHNLRIYYNSQVARLSAFYSALSSDMYEDIEISQLIQNADASAINDLDYDSDMGFVNLSTIHNFSNGSGIEISHDWKKIGSLVFQGSGDIRSMEATWAREVATGAYATAFVEITEWKGDNTTEKVAVEVYQDLTWQRSALETSSPELTIGPNPSTDYVIVKHQWIAPSSYALSNIQGLVLQSGSLNSNEEKISLSQYSAGTYVLQLKSEGTIYNQIVEKVDYN